MADEEKDDAQKTEEPTEKRLEESRKEGQIATSKELTTWLVLLVSAIILLGLGPGFMSDIKGLLLPFLMTPHDILFEENKLVYLFGRILTHIISFLVLPALLFMAIALLAGFVQTKFNFSTKALAPKLERISIIKGFGRLFSMKSFVEMVKSIFKIGIVTGAAVYVIWPVVSNVSILQKLKISEFLPIVRHLSLKVFSGVLGVMSVVVILDYLYQKFTMLKQLRMSKKDIKDEQKEMMGDPQVRQKVRQIRMERSQKRMMAAVPSASVVLTNPTHYSVALRYDSSEMNAPVVVAKGADDIAMKIREVATAHGILLVENKPLTRLLYDTVEVDDEIPVEQYQAVAEVIRYVMETKGVKL